jgi:hypothetical protein
MFHPTTAVLHSATPILKKDIDRGVDIKQRLEDAAKELAANFDKYPVDPSPPNPMLFEAALGTLSMVADEVQGLQAAKIKAAVEILLRMRPL